MVLDVRVCVVAPRQAACLREALAAADVPLLRRHAHTLKGAAGNVGASGVQGVSMQVEEAGGAGRLEEVSLLLDVLDEQLDKFREIVVAAGIVTS